MRFPPPPSSCKKEYILLSYCGTVFIWLWVSLTFQSVYHCQTWTWHNELRQIWILHLTPRHLTSFLSSWGSVSDDQHFSRLSLTQVIPIVHDVINLIISINYSQALKISLLGDNILKCCWGWLDEKLYQANWRQTNKHCKYFWEEWRTVWWVTGVEDELIQVYLRLP